MGAGPWVQPTVPHSSLPPLASWATVNPCSIILLCRLPLAASFPAAQASVLRIGSKERLPEADNACAFLPLLLGRHIVAEITCTACKNLDCHVWQIARLGNYMEAWEERRQDQGAQSRGAVQAAVQID